MARAETTYRTALAVGALALLGYFAVPGDAGKDAAYSVIGLASTACIALALRRRGVGRGSGWWCIAAGNLCFVVGDGVYDVYQWVLHQPVPDPSVADALYLLGYPVLILGIVRITRRAGHSASREGVADAAIVAVGALAVCWHLLMGAYAHDPSMGALARVVAMAYPAMDLGVVFVLAEALLFGGRSRRGLGLLGAAMVAMLAADLAYDLMTRDGTYHVGSPVDAGWLVNYVLVAAAALHPSTLRRAAPGPAAPESPAAAEAGADAGRRLPVVAMAGFVVPAILLSSALGGSRPDLAAMACFASLTFALVVVRAKWLIDRILLQRETLEESLAARDGLARDLQHQAFHDSLTGLANRALLQDRVDRALAASGRSGALVGICLCDLDGFKTVNDSLGHPAGDRVLVATATRLQSVVRPGDTVARLGGDEFAILMEDVRSPGGAAAVAERVVAVMRQPIDVGDRHVTLSASAGVTLSDGSATTEELLSHADAAMYSAKNAGKDGYAVYEEAMRDTVVERLELTSSFAAALERSELFLEYQPYRSLTDGRIEGFEALVRWQHPTMGRLGPDRFVPLAEETGHIVPIGRWVLVAACQEAAGWQPSHGPPPAVSVNVSGRQLQAGHFVDDVRTALALSGLPPGRLVLEMTETVLVSDAARLTTSFDQLKELGVRLAIDDFGTGYSSLSYLSRLPVDTLKIDKLFVDSLADPSGEGSAFVATIVRLARNLGLQTVAEGLETGDQHQALSELGCDSAQGFLFHRPLPPSAARELLAAGDRSDVGAGAG